MPPIWAPFSALRSRFFSSTAFHKKELYSGRGAVRLQKQVVVIFINDCKNPYFCVSKKLIR